MKRSAYLRFSLTLVLVASMLSPMAVLAAGDGKKFFKAGMKHEAAEQWDQAVESFALAVRIVKLHRYLVKTRGEYTISKQLLKSGTNPGAMVREAQNAESDADFVHKLGIAQKETDETLYWLELLYAAEVLTETEFTSTCGSFVQLMSPKPNSPSGD